MGGLLNLTTKLNVLDFTLPAITSVPFPNEAALKFRLRVHGKGTHGDNKRPVAYMCVFISRHHTTQWVQRLNKQNIFPVNSENQHGEIYIITICSKLKGFLTDHFIMKENRDHDNCIQN